MLDQTSSESMIQNSVSVVDSLSASQNSSINTVICTSSSEKIREGSSCPLFAQVVYLTSDGEEENDLGESFDDDLGGDDQNDGKNSGSSSRKYYGQSELSSKSSPKVMRRSVEEEEEEKDVRKKEEGKDGEDGEERGGKQEEKEKNGHNCGNSISRNHDDHNGHSRSYNPNYDGSNDVTECDQELKKNCGSWQDIFNSFNTTTIATTTTSNPPHFSHHHHHHPHPHHNSSTHRCEQNFSSSLCHSSCASSPSSSLPSSASLSSTGQYQSHHTESFLHSHSNSDPHHHSHRNHHQYSSASDGDNPECAISSSFSLPSSSCCEKDEGHFGSSNIDSIGYHERICNSMDRDFEKNENESSKDGESCEDIDGEEEDEEECSDDQERRNCISHQEHDQDEDKMSIRITPANVYFDCPPLTELLETIVEEDEDQISTSSSSSSSSSASSIPCPQSASQFTTSPINSHHIHSQSEEEILSPGEENDQQTEPHAHCHHHIHHQYPIHQPPPPPPPPHQRSGSHHQLHLHSQSAIQHPHHHQHQQQQQQQLSFDQHQQQQQQQQIQGLPGHIGGSRTVSQPLQQQQHQQSGSLLSQSTCLSSPPPPIHHSHHTHTHSQQQQQPLISQLSTSVQIHQPPQVPPPPTLRSQTIGGLFDPARSEFFSSLTPDSDDSDMTGIIKGPQYKARAPKNIWSPGSTTSSSSDLSPPGATLGPITTASATQTTPTRNDTHIKPSQPDGLPAGFRPVKLSTSTSASAIGTGGGANREASMPGTSDGGTTTTGGDAYITPSSPSEISLPDGGSKMRSESPMMGDGGGGSSSGDRKYWTLPRSHHQHRSGANVSAPYTGAPATFNGQMGDPSSMTRDDDDIVSSLAHEGVQRVITDKAPPANAKFLFESPTTKFYTLPTSQTSSRILHHHLPPPPKCEGIGPVNEAGVPLTLRTGVKDEFGSDWYKSMFRRLHKSDRPRSEADQPIHIHRVRSDRSRDRFDPDYHSEDESSRYLPRHISEYEPGRSSIAYRERDKTQEAASKRSQEHQSTSQDTDNQNGIRPHEMDKPYRHPIQRSDSHHKNCVFNALATNGYESDSSYIIRKKEHPTVPTPASRSTYCAIQRGDMDIPLSGLQKPAPAPRAHKESPHRFDEREVNIHYKTPIQQLVKSSDHFNEDDLVKFQRDVLQRYQDNEHERRLNKEAQRRHHFTPTQEHIIHLDRYQKAYAQKGETPRILARVLFDFHALSGREISIKKGDIVIITQPIDHNWVEIEDSQSGLKGLVPRNYLDYDQEGVAKALFDFQGKTSVEISFQKDEMLKVTRKVDDNWFEGVNEQGRSGIFPCSYVEMLKTPLYLQLNNNDFISSPSPRADSSLSRPHSASHILSPVRPSSPIRHVNGTRSKDLFELANPGRHTKHYRAIYPYKPQQMDELELIPGDILNVTMHCDDGWFVGHSTITGQFGTFPGNYVEPFM
ncbi:uncharacterized protein LOC141848957 isoform X4 [Brevipalpus obovatus]|uniref:uncharacterized protein LOC141848957 isoform X4 n=1 Tax=Brevipalpus obovatus TaxID=246614 RepID=UPI003D9E0175